MRYLHLSVNNMNWNCAELLYQTKTLHNMSTAPAVNKEQLSIILYHVFVYLIICQVKKKTFPNVKTALVSHCDLRTQSLFWAVSHWAGLANVRSSGKEEKEDPREVSSTKKQGKKRENPPWDSLPC